MPKTSPDAISIGLSGSAGTLWANPAELPESLEVVLVLVLLAFEPGMGAERVAGAGDADHDVTRIAVIRVPALEHHRSLEAGMGTAP